jgi:hypothetical protein
VRKIHEPSSRSVFESHWEPIGHRTLISTRGLDGDDVELEEFDGVCSPVVTRADVRLELVRPDHVALLTSEGKEPRVVDGLPGGLDVLASFADVINGAVLIFAAALKGGMCVFRSALDDFTAGLPARRGCGTGSHFLGLGGLPISDARGAVPCRRIWFSRALGSSLGRVFVGDGDELSDSSAPPLAPVVGGLIAQKLLRHGEGLRRRHLTPRTSARSGSGGEGERRLYTPRREVGGLQIFLLFFPGRSFMTTEDGLGMSPDSITAAKTLESCVGVSHVEADLKKTHYSPLPGAPNVDGFRVARTRGTTRRTQRFERRVLNV